MRIQGMINLAAFHDGHKKELIRELKEYYSRNKLVFFTRRGNKVHSIETICKSCFVAHALNTAKKLGFDDRTLHAIERQTEKVGHSGYYSDDGEVVECESFNDFIETE